MSDMKRHSLLILLFLVVFGFDSIAQQKVKPNYLYTRITVPVWVDMTEGANYNDPKREDFEKTWTNNVFDIYVWLDRIPIDSDGRFFHGVFNSDLTPYGTYNVRGRVSEDHKMLNELQVTKNVDYEKDGYQEIEKWTVVIQDMPLVNGIGQLSKEKTKVKVNSFENRIKTTSSSRVEYKEYVFKSVDEDKIQPPPYGGRFVLNLNVDGPPTYTISVTDVRGPDPAWEPPAAQVNPDYFAHDPEPNSISFYANYTGLDDTSKMWTKYFYWQTMFGLFNIPGLKVLERGELKQILREIDMSQSGLVREETKVNSGRMMKEEVAIITMMDMHRHILEINVQSRKGEKKVTIQNLTDQNREFAFNAAKKETIRIANGYLRDKLIPAAFYQ